LNGFLYVPVKNVSRPSVELSDSIPDQINHWDKVVSVACRSPKFRDGSSQIIQKLLLNFKFEGNLYILKDGLN